MLGLVWRDGDARGRDARVDTVLLSETTATEK
jgi:hypothetical protein